MLHDRHIKTISALFGVALGVCLVGCSLNPQPLPPGVGEPTGSTTTYGAGEEPDAAALAQSADGGSDAAADADAADGNAVDGSPDVMMPSGQDGGRSDACAAAPCEDAGENGGDAG